jgi:hypothetical protein
MSGDLQTTRMDVRRLIVLVPDQGADGNSLAQQVWTLAAPCQLPVLFLCAPESDAFQESAVYLRLITLASQIRNDQVQVDTCIESGLNWAQAVSHHWEPGDIVICCAEQTYKTATHGRQPLWQMLEYTLGVPVFVLEGVYARESVSDSQHGWNVARWLVSLILIALFFFVETRIDSATAGLARTLILVVFAIAEVGLLAAWSLFT